MYKIFYNFFMSLSEEERINLLSLLYEKGGNALLSYLGTKFHDFIS